VRGEKLRAGGTLKGDDVQQSGARPLTSKWRDRNRLGLKKQRHPTQFWKRRGKRIKSLTERKIGELKIGGGWLYQRVKRRPKVSVVGGRGRDILSHILSWGRKVKSPLQKSGGENHLRSGRVRENVFSQEGGIKFKGSDWSGRVSVGTIGAWVEKVGGQR